MSKSRKAAKIGHVSKPVLVAIIATVLLISFIVIALILEPQDPVPVFNLTDQNGDWDAQAQGKIAVFDEKIHPGSEGEYKFIIKNESEANLVYGFRLSEYLNNKNSDAKAFMEYRLKTDNIYLGDGEWHLVGMDYSNIEILPGTEHLMTLEWRWPFEIDDPNDENDTLIGITGGELSVHIFVWATVSEEELW